jgi:predicted transcriptional regulator
VEQKLSMPAITVIGLFLANGNKETWSGEISQVSYLKQRSARTGLLELEDLGWVKAKSKKSPVKGPARLYYTATAKGLRGGAELYRRLKLKS